jgi:threonine dehydrogenase-like Zn-dependent dehydrogenase
VQEIQFVSLYNVTAITKVWDTSKRNQLGPNQVEIESICSLISSGTELKIFKGMFESAALDVNIKGMSDESMEYPLSYGYSLVGRVVACGAEVDDSESMIGKLAFVFAPHSSRVIVEREAIQLVPGGIDAEDAIFMPSVETALSLVHDANIRVGENVAVYGQGLIGLLVTSILSMQTSPTAYFSSEFSSVTSFDTIGERLAVSSMMGATNALHPECASAAGPFDVSIEVSGNPGALQSAINNTSDNGRIIVGSWYGNSNVTLKLGIDFHRSHKTIQTSQVSNIPCALTGLWSKERRFALTWTLVKAIRPSRLISKKMTLDDAQHAYELLDKGREIAICFSYL